MGVYWAEDPDYRHEGWCELIDRGGRPWHNPRQTTWISLLSPGHTAAPDMAGLRAACACTWRASRVVPLTVNADGTVAIDPSEDECLVEHHVHVRHATDTQRKRDLETGIRAIIGEVGAAELPVLDRLTLTVAAERAAGGLRGQLIGQARAQGADWTEIGRILGVSKQAAQQRYGTPTTGVNQ